MPDASPEEPGTTRRADPHSRSALLAVAALACAVVVLVAVAAWQVGAPPKAADDGFPDSPPPLALPSETSAGSPLARAAGRLAADELDAARAGFVDVVATDQEGVAGQVGLVLSRWRSTGPVSVERDLLQLTREYPGSALAALHLGMVQLLLGQDRSARETLRGAREVGLDAGDPTSLRMARLADDLLHPTALRGSMPVLVQPSEVTPRARPSLRRLLRAVSSGDRREAARVAARLERSGDALVRVAAISGTFDKADAGPTRQRLAQVAGDAGAPRAARDRAELMATLAQMWAGGSRSEACTRLAAHAGPRVDQGTRRLAGPIRAELCLDAAARD